MTYSLILILLIFTEEKNNSLDMERLSGYPSEQACISAGRDWIRGYPNNRDFSCVPDPEIEDKKESEDS